MWAQDPLVLWGLTDRRRYCPPAVAVSLYLFASAAGQLAVGFRAGAHSLLDEHAREAMYLLRCGHSQLGLLPAFYLRAITFGGVFPCYWRWL